MKINESFGPPSEHDVVDETRRMESEVLTQLKSEFLEFVTQTRERLRLVSESLSELDREYMIQPQIIDQPVSVAEQLEAEPIVETEATPISRRLPSRPLNPIPPSRLTNQPTQWISGVRHRGLRNRNRA